MRAIVCGACGRMGRVLRQMINEALDWTLAAGVDPYGQAPEVLASLELCPEADIEIVETHHNHKLDAPSGTALMLAEAIGTVRDNPPLQLGRSGNCPRQKGEIGIHAVRRGEIVGIHEVLISTPTQTVTLRHEAHTRALFAEGAMAAAEYLCAQGPGLYNMQSMIDQEN